MKGLLSLSGVFAAAVLVAGSAFAQGQNDEGRGRRPDRQGPPRWANAGGNQDGETGRPGRPQGHERPSLAEVDTDGDGVVSEAERNAFREKMRERFMEKARERVLEHFDDNGDGVLSGEELNKVARALMRRRGGRPGQGSRPGGDRDNGSGGKEGHKPPRQGPPRRSNAGGNQGDGRQAPPPWANAGGRDRSQGRGPAGE